MTQRGYVSGGKDVRELAQPKSKPGHDEDGIAILEEVEADLIPLVRKYGWDAISDALFHQTLWNLRGGA